MRLSITEDRVNILLRTADLKEKHAVPPMKENAVKRNIVKNCWGKLFSKFFPADWENRKICKKVPIKSIKGFLIGPVSMTFKRLLFLDPSHMQNTNQWQYLSLITKDH